MPTQTYTNCTACCLATTGPCCGCSSVPLRYSVPVAGVTNGTCSNCSVYNATHTLTEGVSCIWTSPSLAAACAGTEDAFVDMQCVGDNMILVFNTRNGGDVSGIAEYRKALADWSCLGANTLSLFSNTGDCATWPANLTATPV